MLETDYNQLLTDALIGRQLLPDCMPQAHIRGPMFSFWGEDAGLPPSDIHATRAYRIYLRYGDDLVITDVDVIVEGELISPCSGYRREVLDRFDYPYVLQWCLARLA